MAVVTKLAGTLGSDSNFLIFPMAMKILMNGQTETQTGQQASNENIVFMIIDQIS